jgi:dihydrofolate reductase
MCQLVAGFAASLDGYIEGPNGEVDWILIDKEIDFAEQARRFGAYFYGRRTYEQMLRMKAPSPPGARQFVFSNTLTSVEEGYELLTGNIHQQVNALKQQVGKDIALFGGASLLASLLDLQLVDELTISIIPVLLGKGKPMVDVLKEKCSLQLTHTKQYGNGTVQLFYKPLYKMH